MTTIKIDDELLLEMLIDRVRFWTDDPDTIGLYTLYYRDLIESGCFDGAELDIPVIVDNDYINYLNVYDESDLAESGFDEDRILASKDGYYLVYCA